MKSHKNGQRAQTDTLFFFKKEKSYKWPINTKKVFSIINFKKVQN